MAGGLLVAYCEPVAAGGGIPGIIGYLNGIRVPRIVNLKVLVVKLFSTIFMLLSHVPAGREAPLIHMGAILGASAPMMYIPFTKIRLFTFLHNDHERRDMTSIGVASGLTAAFLTPIGGVILALEEGVTYYSRQLPGRVFLGAFITTYFVTFFISSLEHDCLSCLHKKDLLLLAVDESFKFFEYYIFEIPLFILLGIIGGLAGSAWNYLEMEFTHFRKRFIRIKECKLMELGSIAIGISLWSFCLLYFVEHCRTPLNQKEKMVADDIQEFRQKCSSLTNRGEDGL
uniref:Chloride channel protein n=1 Tax=Rhodnius prolixus TaxID=13249 RepID=T1H828_RHOPR